MRCESRAFGTRDEISQELARNLGAQRSERRQAESRQALEELRSGATAVVFGRTTYVVTGEPNSYLVTVDNPDVVFAWGMEIAADEDPGVLESDRRAIVYIGSSSGEGQISVHESAESACARWSQVVPLSIVSDAEIWAAAYAQNFSSTAAS